MSDAVGVLGDESFDDVDDLVLLAAGKLCRFFKHTMQPAFCRLALGLRRGDAEKLVDAHPEGGRHLWKDFAAWRLVAPFPERNVGLMNAQTLGQLRLREAGSLPQAGQMMPVFGARSL